MRNKHKLMMGLNTRNSDVNRDPIYASDCKNVHFNVRRELRKRFGYDEDSVLPVGSIDLGYYRQGNELISLTPTALLYRDSPGTFIAATFGGDAPAGGWSVDPSFAEYNGVLYWTDPTGLTNLFKYDGFMAYRAGLPQASGVNTSGAGAKHWRAVYKHLDLQGNAIWGDYVQFNSTIAVPTFTIDTHIGTEFHNKHSDSAGAQNLTSAALVFNVGVGHNYIANDYVRILATDGTFYIAHVASVIANTSVTFTTLPSGKTFAFGAGEPLERRNFIVFFHSDNTSYGWRSGDEFVLNTSNATQNATPNSANDNGPMLDIYDDQLIKGLPPRFKYLAIYNNLLIGGNSTEQIDSITQDEGVSEDTIYWSDLSVGSMVENFTPDDFQVIGRTDEGNITGVFSNKYNLTIFKESQVYYLSGDLINRDYRVFSGLSNGIGCVSHKSLVEIEDGVMFMSQKGMFLARNGGKPVELTDMIEPIFTDGVLDLSTANSINDVKNERIYTFISAPTDADKIVLVLDYYYKTWFIYKGILADGGFIMTNDNDLFHADAAQVYLRSLSYNDNGSAIDAYYQTAWIDSGEPALKKKWVDFNVYSMQSKEWEMTVSTQINWQEEDIDTFEQTIGPEFPTNDHKLKMIQARSMRLKIQNNTINQGLFVSGFEYEFQDTQKKAKGSE